MVTADVDGRKTKGIVLSILFTQALSYLPVDKNWELQ